MRVDRNQCTKKAAIERQITFYFSFLSFIVKFSLSTIAGRPTVLPVLGIEGGTGLKAATAVTSVVSDSVRPHRRQPTRLPCPWDSPGKNTGVGCHFLLQCMKVKSETEVAQSCLTLSDPMDCSLLGSSVHGIFQVRVLEWGAIALKARHGYIWLGY